MQKGDGSFCYQFGNKKKPSLFARFALLSD